MCKADKGVGWAGACDLKTDEKVMIKPTSSIWRTNMEQEAHALQDPDPEEDHREERVWILDLAQGGRGSSSNSACTRAVLLCALGGLWMLDHSKRSCTNAYQWVFTAYLEREHSQRSFWPIGFPAAGGEQARVRGLLWGETALGFLTCSSSLALAMVPCRNTLCEQKPQLPGSSDFLLTPHTCKRHHFTF